MSRNGSAILPLSSEETARFLSHVEFCGPLPDQKNAFYRGLSRCFVWKAAKDAKGYGVFSVSARQFKAHRVAYAIHHTGLCGDVCVLHKCDNPSCVNPEHLFVGSHLDNARDRQRKRRGNAATGDRNGSRTKPESCPRGDKNGSRIHLERRAFGDRNGARTHPEKVKRGVQHAWSKLTEERVAQILQMREAGMTQKGIGDIVGLTQSGIGMLLRGKTWRHLSAIDALKTAPLPAQRARGCCIGQAKLTDDAVRRIRELSEQGQSAASLGREYLVSKQTILSIIHRKTWRHIV